MRLKELSGQHFGRLTAIKRNGVNRCGQSIWECLCDCGNTANVSVSHLISGHSKSCGCLLKDSLRKNRFVREPEDLVSKRFGRLLVLQSAGKNKFNQAIWKCLCSCDQIIVVAGSSLKSGHTKSCGCLSRDLSKDRWTIHGLFNHQLYSRWEGMKARCSNPNLRSYKNYGGRGIRVCDEWLNNPVAFIEWGLANGFHPSLHIDRINNDGDYSPDNCRFVTVAQNNLNKRTNRVKLAQAQ